MPTLIIGETAAGRKVKVLVNDDGSLVTSGSGGGTDSDGNPLPNFSTMSGGSTRVDGYLTSIYYEDATYRWTQTWVEDADGATWSEWDKAVKP
jgi:hypothetical protein